MSGPIIRKYGFPNFEKIFGERELKHGVDSEAPKPDPVASSEAPKTGQGGPAPGGSDAPRNPGS